MQIAIKGTYFADTDVSLDMSDREVLAGELQKRAVDIGVPDSYVGMEHVVEYLREHKDAVVVVNGHVPMYYVYRKWMSVKTIPRFQIINVDVTRPWLIDSSYGYENFVYLKSVGNNQYVKEE